jgi:hypothetical protein
MDFCVKRAPVRYRLHKAYRWASDKFDGVWDLLFQSPIRHFRAWLT